MPTKSYKLKTLTESQRNALVTSLTNYRHDVTESLFEEESMFNTLRQETLDYYGSETVYRNVIIGYEEILENIEYLLTQLEKPV